MKTDHRGLFEDLEPPAGGADRFRQRLEVAGDSGDWPLRPLLAASVAVAALVIAAVIALQQRDADSQVEASPQIAAESQTAAAPELVDLLNSKEFDRLLGRPFEPVETRVAINDIPAALTQVPGTRPGIRIYEVRTN